MIDMRDPPTLPPVEVLNAKFIFDPETGTLVKRRRGRNRNKPPRIAPGSKRGYLRVAIDGKLFYVHRVIWKMRFGTEPPPMIDHRDIDASNNRPGNFRPASGAQNSRNRRPVSTRPKASKYKGVYWHKQIGRWRAKITVDRKCLSLGCFATEAEAYAAYLEGAKKYHGDFASGGVVDA